jgi:hypothetical protein
MCPTIVIAKQIATRRVKAELAAQGIKLRDVTALDIKRWAEAYLNQHSELLAEAGAIIEACPELRKMAERERKRLAKTTSVAGREPRPAQPLPDTVRIEPNFRTVALHEQRKREAIQQWHRICRPR